MCEKLGNLITLPPLIIRREFEASAFTIVLGLSTAISGIACSFGPALLGLVRGLSGGYGLALAVCIALQLAAAVIVLWGEREHSAGARDNWSGLEHDGLKLNRDS